MVVVVVVVVVTVFPCDAADGSGNKYYDKYIST